MITDSTPTVNSAADPLACPRCGVIDTPTLGPGNGPHAFRALCRCCGAFLRWLSTRSPAERQARRRQARQEAMTTRPPSARQLDYLAALGDDAPPPASMLEASQRIEARLHGEVV